MDNPLDKTHEEYIEDFRNQKGLEKAKEYFRNEATDTQDCLECGEHLYIQIAREPGLSTFGCLGCRMVREVKDEQGERMSETKDCYLCGKSLPLTLFYKMKNRGKPRYHSYCIPCHTIYTERKNQERITRMRLRSEDRRIRESG